METIRLPLLAKILLALSLSTLLLACGQEPEIQEEKLTRVTNSNLSELLLEYPFFRPAQVISLHNSILSAELNAPVQKIHAQVGDIVSQGEPLVELNCTDERYRLQQASSQLAAADAASKLSALDYQRAQRLFKQKNISKQELDRLQSEHDRNKANQGSAKAAYQLASNAVEKCLVRAPFNAIVMERQATVGQLASIGAPLIRVIDAERLELSAFLSAQEAAILKNSENYYFLLDGKKYALELRSITPAIDSVRRTQEVRLRFTEAAPLPGSFGELVWLHPQPALPAEYLSQRKGSLGLLYTNQQANKTLVAFQVLADAKEGQPYPLDYSAYDNLSESTSIIVDGRFGLSIGAEVEVLER